jgi:hypothetical protein
VTPLDAILKAVGQGTWDAWSPEQRAFVQAYQGADIGKLTLGGAASRYYERKKWRVDATRPQYGEACDACRFPFCFYAEPRNGSMSPESDVWNVMKCANHACGKLFESCL